MITHTSQHRPTRLLYSHPFLESYSLIDPNILGRLKILNTRPIQKFVKFAKIRLSEFLNFLGLKPSPGRGHLDGLKLNLAFNNFFQRSRPLRRSHYCTCNRPIQKFERIGLKRHLAKAVTVLCE